VRRAVFLLMALATLVGCAGNAEAQPSGRARVIVTFDRPPGVSEQALIHDMRGMVKHTYRIVPAMAVEVPSFVLPSLRVAPGVVMVEEDQVVRPLDSELDVSWGVKRIGAGEVHPFNTGQGVKVAVIDSGIDDNHPDLDGNYAGGYDFADGDPVPFDDCGHGTMVAGVVAAEDNGVGVVGVAPAADLYALRAMKLDGGQCQGLVSDVIEALDWAVYHHMDVVNMSLGTSDYYYAFETAVQNAYDAGLVLVAAAGNEYGCPNPDPFVEYDNVLYPALFDEVIAVAATDQFDQRACFSSTGPAVELAAPGVSIYTTSYPGPPYWWAWGTSLASPHVAGAAALVLASGITDSNSNGRVNDEVRARLQQTADDLGAPGRDTWYGFGLVDVVEAVQPSGDDDSDGDGFTDAVETYIGTDPFDSCPDDPTDDAWPPDIDKDMRVTIGDVLYFRLKLRPNPYDPRFDLNADSEVNIGDVLMYAPIMGARCTNP